MNRLLKTVVLSTAVAATTLVSLPMAEAGERWSRHGGPRYQGHSRSIDGGDLAVAGILGLAAGALIVGLANQPAPPREPIYVKPRPRPDRGYPAYVQYDRDASYGGGGYAAIEPWTADWYGYCSDRYRTFNERTGTYVGYDGQRHFCVAN